MNIVKKDFLKKIIYVYYNVLHQKKLKELFMKKTINSFILKDLNVCDT